MFERLERITWLIEVVQDDEVVRRVAGFSVHAHLIMSSADRFRDIDENDTSVKIRARLRKDNGWARAELVFMMEQWDIILFKVSSSLTFEGARFVSDGTLSENQTLFHMGHQMPWTYHVSRVCSPCVENVILPSRFSEMTCERKIPSSSEKFPTYPVMGHVWNREFYENYHKEHGKHLDFARDFHAHVPIIQLTGFSSCGEDLGGPIINTSGEIVGMFAGSGSQCVGIHVTALKEFLKYYNGNYLFLHHLYF